MSSNENYAAAAYGNVWLDANRYYEAERRHYEISLAELASEVRKRANPGSPPSKVSVPNGMSQSSLASEIAYARQKIQNFLKSGDVGMEFSQPSVLARLERFEKEHAAMKSQIEQLTADMNKVLSKLSIIEKAIPLKNLPVNETQVPVKGNTKSNIQNGAAANEDDDLDLFGSDEEDADATKLREERLQAYANKKAKKPALVAKSSVVLDVKPWDDETDMKAMETEVRKIQTEGLVWGASKLVPLAYGINKLQIVAIVEDEKVSIDWLQETISEIEELVQSVDIAAFNKL